MMPTGRRGRWRLVSLLLILLIGGFLAYRYSALDDQDAQVVGPMPKGFKLIPRSRMVTKHAVDTKLFGAVIRYPSEINVPIEFRAIKDMSGILEFPVPQAVDPFTEAPWEDESGTLFWPEPVVFRAIPSKFALPLIDGTAAQSYRIRWQTPGGTKYDLGLELPPNGKPVPTSPVVKADVGPWDIELTPLKSPGKHFKTTYALSIKQAKPDETYLIEMQSTGTAALKTTRIVGAEPGHLVLDQFETGQNWELWVHKVSPKQMELTTIRVGWDPDEYRVVFRDEAGKEVAACRKGRWESHYRNSAILDRTYMAIEIAGTMIDTDYPKRGSVFEPYTGSLVNLKPITHGGKIAAVGYIREHHAHAPVSFSPQR